MMRKTIARGDGILNPPKALFLRAKGCAWNQQALGTEVVRRHARPPGHRSLHHQRSHEPQTASRAASSRLPFKAGRTQDTNRRSGAGPE